MIHLRNKDKIKIAGLVDYKDLYIEKDLASGNKLLAFSYPKTSKFYFDIEEECYITTKEDSFIVKEKNVQSDYTEFKCTLNLEDLEGKPWERYESVEQTIDKALALVLAGTGWIVGSCSLKKKRTVRASNVSSLDIIGEIRKTYRCDLVFNTLTRTIDVHEHLGEDRGTYFIDSLNLKTLSIQGNSYDFFTRIIPIGKDDLRIKSINNGKEYVENYQYSNKVKTCYWKDERYTIVENLKEDAEAKLNEISKPYRSYSAEILNLAKLNDKYKDILDFKLGDTITLISKDNKFRDKQRIVKIIEHPDEHELDSVELANTKLSFEEIQTQFQEATDTVNNITTDNGTIDGSTVDEIETNQIKDFDSEVIRASKIEALDIKVYNLEANNVTITGRLNAVEATIGTLEANIATIDKLTVTHSAYIADLQASKASITQLEAVNATIHVLESRAANIETLVNGNLSSENIQAGGITSDRLTIENGFIKSAMIDSLDVSKVTAGDISTNKFRIKSDDGGIEIVGATQQFKDKNNKVRIQMGKDALGNFNFIIRGEDGTTTLIDHTGVKPKAIADDLIKENMIAEDAVGEKQINYTKFIEGFNKDTNTKTLKATKIQLDNQNQTLEFGFNQLKTQSDETKTTTESNTTELNIHQGKIESLIANTTIVKDGKTTTLKDDYNNTVQTVDSMKSTIGSHTTQINDATGKITGVETRVNTVERDLNGVRARVSGTETNIESLNSEIITTKNKVSAIEVNLNSITSRVSSVETTNTLLGEASFQNLLSNTDLSILKNDGQPDGWINSGIASLDANKLLDGIPSFHYKVTGFNSDTWKPIQSSFIPCLAGQSLVGSWYVWIPSGVNIDRGLNIEIEFFRNDDVKISMASADSDLNIRDKWQRIIAKGVAPAGCAKSRLRIHCNRNGEFYASKPMVQLGNTVTGWQKGINISQTEARLKYAEQKITDASIISTVSSQFYKKGETDSRYASQTQITQLSNQISSKVDVGGVKSIIQQNPNDVMIGFNGINNRININPRSMDFTAVNGNRDMLLYGGQVCVYNNMNNTFLATVGSVVNATNTFKGCGFLLSIHCSNFVIGRDNTWDDVLTNRSPKPTHAFNIDFVNNRVHVLYGMSTGDINLQGNNLGDVNVAYIKDLYTFGIKDHNTGKNLITSEGNRLVIGVPMSFNGQTLMNPTLYTDKLFFTNGQLAFGQHSSGANIMMNGVHWDWQGFNIVNARLQASYSLAATSPGRSVGADTASVETMLLQEDFSEYDELNNAVVVDMNEGFKNVYAGHKSLENENEQLKIENNHLKEELSITKNALDAMLMNVV